MGIFKKINFGLRKTRNNVSGAIDNVLDSYTSIDQELFDELEEALVMGDVGVSTASEITLRLNDVVRKKGIKNPADVKAEIKDIVAEMLEGGEDMGLITIPSVILVIGVNGVGKTTTIGKLAARYKAEGKKDTFMTLEPHLQTFSGLNALVGKKFDNPYKYENQQVAFTDAVEKLRGLV